MHGLITDVGSNFMQLSRELGISKQNSTFLVDGTEILYIFDPPYLMKRTRDNLLKYNVEFGVNKVAHIIEFYKKDSQ